MIFDGENKFFDGVDLKAATLTSEVVSVGVGESGDGLRLVALVSSDAGTGTLSTVVETSDSSDFAKSSTLGTFTGAPLKVIIPRGNLGYLRLKSTSTYTKGTITAGIVLDDDIL